MEKAGTPERARECVEPVLEQMFKSNQTVAESISTCMTILHIVCDRENIDFEEILAIGIQTDREQKGYL